MVRGSAAGNVGKLKHDVAPEKCASPARSRIPPSRRNRSGLCPLRRSYLPRCNRAPKRPHRAHRRRRTESSNPARPSGESGEQSGRSYDGGDWVLAIVADRSRRPAQSAIEQCSCRGLLLARHGIDCPTVTRAGTGSFEFEATSGVISARSFAKTAMNNNAVGARSSWPYR